MFGLFGGWTDSSVNGWVVGWVGSSFRTWVSFFVPVGGGPVIFLGGLLLYVLQRCCCYGGWLGRRVGGSCGTWVNVFVSVHRPALAYFGSSTINIIVVLIVVSFSPVFGHTPS